LGKKESLRALSLKRARKLIDTDPKDQAFVGKYHCMSSWCSRCWPKILKPVVKRLGLWEWSRVRQIVLTVDPKRYADPKGAYESTKKRLGRIERYLRGVLGIEDYVWFREWHKSGFVHYHFLVLQSESVGGVQIGQEVIHGLWGENEWIRETYFNSQGHWFNTIGYLGKSGYLNKGERQGRLPDWAGKEKRIRRYGGMIRKQRFGVVIKNPVPRQYLPKEFRVVRPFLELSEKIEACKNWSVIILRSNEIEGDVHAVVNIPYRDLTSRPGVYIKRFGYLLFISEQEAWALIRDHGVDPYQRSLFGGRLIPDFEGLDARQRITAVFPGSIQVGGEEWV